MLEIDGSQLEGGGSIVRISTALATLIGKPIGVYNIRAKRSKPGLQTQHLEALRALAKLSDGKLEGDELNSMEIKLYPGEIQEKKINVEIKTAGSIGLVLQCLMIPAAFSNGAVFVEFKGGATDTPRSPSIDFFKNITLPTLGKMGYSAKAECNRRGHYPRGGAMVRARISPVKKLSPINLTDPGRVIKISGISHCVRLPAHVATRQAHAAKQELLRAGYADVKITTEFYGLSSDPHLGPGSGITLWAETEHGAILGSSALGKPKKPAEEVGREAAKKLLAQLQTGGAVDRHLTDQLIPYMALADGTSEITSSEITLHTITNLSLMEKILCIKFDLEGEIGKLGRVQVNGCGFTNSRL
jgi:RNA 3'-phosphate cyclase